MNKNIKSRPSNLLTVLVTLLSCSVFPCLAEAQEWPSVPVAPTFADCSRLRQFYYNGVGPIRRQYVACMRSPTDYGKAQNCEGKLVADMWAGCTNRFKPEICRYEKFFSDVVTVCEQNVNSASSYDFTEKKLTTIQETIKYIDNLKKQYEEVSDLAKALSTKDSAIQYIGNKLTSFPLLRNNIVQNRIKTISNDERNEIMEYIFKSGRYALSNIPSSALVKAIQREALAHIEIQSVQAEAHLKKLRLMIGPN